MRTILSVGFVILFSCGLYIGMWYLKRSDAAIEVSDLAFLVALKQYKPDYLTGERAEVEIEGIELDEHERYIKELVRHLYTGISGFRVSKQERESVCTTGIVRELTYGEITFDALQVIFNDLALTHDDVFYDLGSGVGKTVLQAVLATPIRKAVGIELVPTRVALARKAYANIVGEDRMPHDKVVEYRQENMLDTALDDATIVYLCSTCYSPQLMRAITDKLMKVPHPALRIITLKKLPANKVFTLVKQYQLPTSWSKRATVYLYAKDNQSK